MMQRIKSVFFNNKYSNSVILSDGLKYDFYDLPLKVPSPVMMTNDHIDTCHCIADQLDFPSYIKPVYINFLITRSRWAMSMTALRVLDKKNRVVSGNLKIGGNLNLEKMQTIIPKSIVVLDDKSATTQFLPLSYLLLRFMPRMLLHIFFRIFFPSSVSHDSAVRSWIDISTRLYPNQMTTSKVLIYPFAANFFRQVKYLKSIQEKKYSWSLAGLPYECKDIITAILRCRTRDLVIASIEHRVFSRHADEIFDLGIKKLYTTDEFEPAAHVLHQSLMARDVLTINSCHGIAAYGPYIAASTMIYCNERQKKYYSPYAIINKTLIQSLPSKFSVREDTGEQPTFIVIHGFWDDKPYEQYFSEAMLDRIAIESKKLGFKWLIKVHPDTRSKQMYMLKKNYHVEVIKNNEFPSGPLVFINNLSSGLYDFRNLGPTLFVGDELLNPADLFGVEAEGIMLDQLPFDIMKCFDVVYRENLQDQQSKLYMSFTEDDS